MHPGTAQKSAALSMLLLALIFAAGCTFYGEHPARGVAEVTGGEGLERIFWKNVHSANWVEIDRALASNFTSVTATGTMDRSATISQYRTWQLKDFAIGDLQTQLNGTTMVVTYAITLNGTVSSGNGASQPLPSAPQHMMTVWQQEKKGWIAIAHSSTQ
jgi:hypothetical protein